jgi:NNP family nitrate/nitrite transporter-like MFS transporter
MGIAFAHDYTSFLVFRLAIGAIGASFVITQYHTSVMFAPNCVGTANATSAGWGNLGGGVTQMVMPLVFAAFIGLGFSDYWGWRLSMVVAGGICFLAGIAYYFFTTDLPDGNFKELRSNGDIRSAKQTNGTFMLAAKDKRVWALFGIYAACFGIELTINNMAALYYRDYFGLGLATAGLVAGLFGLMNIFARTMGGVIGDRFALKGGLKGRVRWLFIALAVEGIALMIFSRMTVLPFAIASMIVFSLFVQMSEGATYSVVPFINKKALGSVAGIVGAGGNMGAVAAGFLLRAESITWPQALLILGGLVLLCSSLTFMVTFSNSHETEVKQEYDKALVDRAAETKEARRWLPIPQLSTMFGNLGVIDALRIYLGIALVSKGIYFVMNMQEIESLVGGIGMLENVGAWYVVFVHIVGGFTLAVGLGTRVASALNITVLLGAVIFVHSAEGLFSKGQGLEFSLFVLFALCLVMWRGAGKVSVDNFLRPQVNAND